MTTFPTASVVSRALRRDAAIITMPIGRQGYHVRGNGSYAASISVDLTDLPIDNPREDVAGAADLLDHLVALGWEAEIDPAYPTFVHVTRVPTAAELRAKVAESPHKI